MGIYLLQTILLQECLEVLISTLVILYLHWNQFSCEQFYPHLFWWGRNACNKCLNTIQNMME